MAELDSAIQGPPAANTVLDRRVKPGDDSPAMPRRVGELLDIMPLISRRALLISWISQPN
jgi:hypothetical protein